VVGDGRVQFGTQLPAPRHVLLRDRALERLDLRVLLQLLEDRQRPLGVQQRLVEVDVDAEPRRQLLGKRRDDLAEVPPRTALDLELGVPLVDGPLGLGEPVLGGHVHRPPRQRHPVPDLGAQQPPRRHVQPPPDGVEQRHLESGAEVVVPQQVHRVRPEGPLDVLVLGRPPGVVQHRLADPRGADLDGHLRDLGVPPVRDPPVHVRPGDIAVGKTDDSAVDVGDGEV